MALFFCKRHTLPLRMKSNGVAIFYSHGTTNSCGVAIAFLGSKSLEVVESKNNDQGRILTLDIKICDKELLLVNLYNTNTEN